MDAVTVEGKNAVVTMAESQRALAASPTALAEIAEEETQLLHSGEVEAKVNMGVKST